MIKIICPKLVCSNVCRGRVLFTSICMLRGCKYGLMANCVFASLTDSSRVCRQRAYLARLNTFLQSVAAVVVPIKSSQTGRYTCSRISCKELHPSPQSSPANLPVIWIIVQPASALLNRTGRGLRTFLPPLSPKIVCQFKL